ncbi:MAG: restriction endonuclease subunit S [Rhodothermales bacterium]
MSGLAADWPVVELSELLVNSATYGIVKAGNFQRSGVPMVRGGDIKGGRINFNLPFVSERKSEEYDRTLLEADDVLIALVGYPGESAVVREWLVGGNISRAVGLLRPRDCLNSEYLAYYLNSPLGRQEFLRPGAGSAQIVVNLKDLNRLSVPHPPLPEQRAIAAALSDVDALIAKLDALIAKKRAIKTAAMQRLLTGEQRLPGFSGAWETRRVSEFGDVITGGTPPTGIGRFWGGDNLWVTPSDIGAKKDIRVTARTLTSEGLNVLRMLPRGAVLITCIASLGKNAVLPATGACNQQINAIIPNGRHDSDFLYYLFENNKDVLLASAGKTATHIVSKSRFSDLAFLVPSISEQEAIAETLSDMDAEIDALKARRDKTQAIKQGMMQELLTGKTRLV